jgi:hypothetical protein
MLVLRCLELPPLGVLRTLLPILAVAAGLALGIDLLPTLEDTPVAVQVIVRGGLYFAALAASLWVLFPRDIRALGEIVAARGNRCGSMEG